MTIQEYGLMSVTYHIGPEKYLHGRVEDLKPIGKKAENITSLAFLNTRIPIDCKAICLKKSEAQTRHLLSFLTARLSIIRIKLYKQ